MRRFGPAVGGPSHQLLAQHHPMRHPRQPRNNPYRPSPDGAAARTASMWAFTREVQPTRSTAPPRCDSTPNGALSMTDRSASRSTKPSLKEGSSSHVTTARRPVAAASGSGSRRVARAPGGAGAADDVRRQHPRRTSVPSGKDDGERVPGRPLSPS